MSDKTITFDYEVPSLEEFRARIGRIKERYPYLVIIRDDVIEGYAYAGVFKDRAAYDRSCEMTIYLDCNAKGSGLGRKLYTALEEALKAQGILNLYACIGVPEEPDEYLDFNSEQFHAHLGYTTVGSCVRRAGIEQFVRSIRCTITQLQLRRLHI